MPRPHARKVDLINGLIRGALAGAVATAPMTILMEAMNRSVPRGERKPLPPRQITESLAERATTGRNPDGTSLDAATMAAHFAFGAGAGAAFGLMPDRVRRRPFLAGVGFGLALWASSYGGVLPAFELQRRPDRRSGWRNATMIAGHVTWGAVLGLVEKELRHPDEAPGEAVSGREPSGYATLRSSWPKGHSAGPADIHW